MRPLARMAAALAVVLAAGACDGNEDGPGRDAPPIRLVVDDPEPSAGSTVSVRYVLADGARAEQFEVGPGLALKRDGRVVRTLVVGFSDRPPEVRPAGSPVEAIALVGDEGTGPYDVLLPDVPAGEYELCGSPFSRPPRSSSPPDDVEETCAPVRIASE